MLRTSVRVIDHDLGYPQTQNRLYGTGGLRSVKSKHIVRAKNRDDARYVTCTIDYEYGG